MKILIIYFSQTGNTKKAADCIKQGINDIDPEYKCELIKLSDVEINKLSGYDLVGIGCPVWYYQEPLNIQYFIRDLPGLPGKHWFVFCSHGAMIGKTLPSMEEGLLKKGIKIIGYYDTFADATAPFIPRPTITNGHPDERDLDQAREFGSELIKRFKKILSGEEIELPNPELLEEKWILKAKLFTKFVMDNYLPRLEVDLLKCSLCRTCEKTCPVGGIDIGACPPRIQEPCIYCYRCTMVCPEVAIDAKDGKWGVLYDTLPGLYDDFRPLLEKAISEKKFKWYVDPEQIDFPNTQLVQRRQARYGK